MKTVEKFAAGLAEVPSDVARTPRFIRYATPLFVLWALWLTAEYWSFGSNSYVRLHNIADESLPQLIALKANFLHRMFGRWNPFWSSGADRAALPFSRDMDVVPFLILPGWLAYATVSFLQRLVAGLFTFRLLQRRMGVSPWPALYASLAYSLFAQPLLDRGWTGFALFDYLAVPGIPFVLWLLSGIQAERRNWSVLLAVLAGLWLGFAGSLHISLFVGPLVIYWSAAICPRRESAFWRHLLVFFLTWGVIAVFVNAPLLGLARDSTRYTYQLGSIWAIGVMPLIVGVVGWLLAEIVPVILIGIGLSSCRFRSRRLNALLAAIAFCLFVGSSYDTVAEALRTKLPFLRAFNFGRINLLLPFLFLVAAAVALDEFSDRSTVALQKDGVRRYSVPLVALVSTVLVGVVGWESLQVKTQTLRDMLDGHNYRAYYLNPDLQRLAEETSAAPPFRVATVATGSKFPSPDFPPGALWAYGFETADGFLNLQPKRYHDFWEYVIGPLMASDEGVYHWVHDFGCQLNLFAPAAGFSPNKNFGDYYRRNLLSLANVRYIVSPVKLQDDRLVPIPSQTRQQQLIWRALNRPHRLISIVRGDYPGAALYLYENPDVLPRFFFADTVQFLPDGQSALAAMASRTSLQLRSSVFIEARYATQLRTVDERSDDAGAIELVKYSADEIELNVSTRSSKVLVVSNNYSPYWKAWIDGQTTSIVPADYTFQGLTIPIGAHRVVLRYVPAI
jgi:uncharacterized membrane protein YvlD (DUF360 family)